MKIYNTNKEFLLNVETRNEVIANYPKMLAGVYSVEKPSDNPMEEPPRATLLEEIPLVCIGGIIEGCINLDSLDKLTDKHIEDIKSKLKTMERKNTTVKPINDDFRYRGDTYREDLESISSHFTQMLKGIKLEEAKLMVSMEMKTLKKTIQYGDVTSPVDGVDYNFFGGSENVRNYSDALQYLLMRGSKESPMRVREGLISIGEEDVKRAISKMSFNIYESWVVEQHSKEDIEKCKTIDDLMTLRKDYKQHFIDVAEKIE